MTHFFFIELVHVSVDIWIHAYLPKFSVLNKLVKDHVPEIGFLGIMNQTQNGFQASWTRLFFIFRRTFDIFDKFFQSFTEPLACSTLKHLQICQKFGKKMKKNLVQLSFQLIKTQIHRPRPSLINTYTFLIFQFFHFVFQFVFTYNKMTIVVHEKRGGGIALLILNNFSLIFLSQIIVGIFCSFLSLKVFFFN